MTILEVVAYAWHTPFTTKSDFARLHANQVAAAVSDGLITTKITNTHYGRRWVATPKGIDQVMRHNGVETDDDD